MAILHTMKIGSQSHQNCTAVSFDSGSPGGNDERYSIHLECDGNVGLRYDINMMLTRAVEAACNA